MRSVLLWWSLLTWVLGAAALAPASLASERVLISGESSPNGIFDPSVEYPPAGASGWLSYSAVYGEILPWGPHVETRIARSDDSGATWSFEAVVNPSVPHTLVLPDTSTLEGVWNYEVSSLVHDPDDPGREWKLFAHRIFRKTEPNFTEEQNLPAYSWIALRTASNPAGPWSAERALLSSGTFPPAPYDQVEIALESLDPNLAGLIVYSEPGAFYRAGAIYLSLTGLTLSGAERIVLLASADHAASWQYAGTPLALADAAPLGFLSFDGSAIAEQDGRVFLLVTPESPGVLHDGTLVLEFADLAAGELVRSGGVPVVRKHLPALPGLPPERRGGQADYHARNLAGGVLQPALQLADYPSLFQFFSTGQALIDPLPVPSLSALGVAGAALAVLLAGAVSRALSPPATGTPPPRDRRRAGRPSDRGPCGSSRS